MTLSLRFDRDLCPCGKGRLLKDCCLRMADVVPPSPPTGYSNSRCYARGLQGCSPEISREHFISQSLMGLWGDGDVVVQGDSSLLSGKRIPARAVTSKVLCARHNNVLEPLDRTVAKAFEVLIDEDSGDRIVLVNGLDLERWLVKCLCGWVASGMAADALKRNAWEPSQQWLNILFGLEVMPESWGAYVVYSSHCEAHPKTGRFIPIFRKNTLEPVAMTATLEGFTFLLSMEPYGSRDHLRTARLAYRPKEVQAMRGDRSRTLHLGWVDAQGAPVSADNGVVALNVGERAVSGSAT